MSFEIAKKHLESLGFGDRIQEFDVSSATVELAAKAVGTEPERIAKSLTFMVSDKAIIIICAGNVKVNNSKYKSVFGEKAKMLTKEQVKEMIGHEVGGVCPFGIKADIKVYLDSSLKQYDTIYPACGSDNSAVKLTPNELEKASGAIGWIDVCI